MPQPDSPLRLRNLRFNLLAKNIVSGIGVLLTPGLVFLVSLVVLLQLYFRADSGGKLLINWPFIFGGLLVVSALGGLAAWWLIRFISRSVTEAAASAANSAKAMAAGDFTRGARGVTNDELSDLAAVMNSTRNSLSDLLTDTREVYREVATQEERLRETVGGLSDSSGEVSSKVSAVSQRARELYSTAENLAQAASDISSARQRIAVQAASTLEIGVKEVEKVAAISSLIKEFSQQSAEISEAVEQIADIAERTSLLALNATIESAKAGEIGAGFAVVAGQIKDLAVQTSSAAETVTEASATIQTRCDVTVGMAQTVSEKLTSINASQTESSQAVSDQASVVQAMESSCTEALGEAKTLSEEISSISTAAGSIRDNLEIITAGAGQARQSIDSVRALVSHLDLNAVAETISESAGATTEVES
ncbi:MAG: methyl-accepting chemotaxis protein [Mobiluncus sp.]|uniref:methyl-accepting chemotaxis protein n=1 Tax=Mobiluncus sp. TaxID=47293 RepID=UPI00258ED727|nr:methyl-accepting chemotaxis protein [Mobiluncus sp.]MCI6585308.1 methyl-accepting chemotaxis protein [Mobiluncus sp.]